MTDYDWDDSYLIKKQWVYKQTVDIWTLDYGLTTTFNIISFFSFKLTKNDHLKKFKQSDTFRQNYGSHQYTLQSGSDSLPEPISLKLETIDLALDPIYWQRYDELVASGICASDDQQHLQTRKSNLERALTEYAAYKMAPTPSGKKQINRDSF